MMMMVTVNKSTAAIVDLMIILMAQCIVIGDMIVIVMHQCLRMIVVPSTKWNLLQDCFNLIYNRIKNDKSVSNTSKIKSMYR